MNERQLPLFAGTDLAERIENAERTMISEAAEAAARRNHEGRCFVTPLAGGVAAWAGEGSPLNKVAGLGFGGAVDEGELAAIEQAYAERGAPVQAKMDGPGKTRDQVLQEMQNMSADEKLRVQELYSGS